jgi:hypothetical protein
MAKRQPPLVPLTATGLSTWFERDRAYVGLENKLNGKTIIEWWDEDVTQAIEDGFLEVNRGNTRSHSLHSSAYYYAVSVGLIRDR